MKNFKTSLLSGLVAFTLNSTSTAFAQETTTGTNGTLYEPAYFSQYAPRTALDMINHIPGFSLQFGDNRRGLGQGGANIIINGARITGKTNPRDQLSAITAPNVVKIEIVDGASLDIPGLSGQVANITTMTTGISGTWEWNPEFRKGLEANYGQGSVTISGESGNLSYSATLKSRSFRNGHRGLERQIAADGTVFEHRDEDGQYYGDRPSIATNFTWKPKPDHIGNLNLEYALENFNGRQISLQTALTPRGSNDQTLFSDAEDEKNYEAGGDYEFPTGPGKLKLIGFYRYETSPSVSRFDVFGPTGQTEGDRYNSLANEAEAILRSEYSWSPKSGRDWQLGIEGAFNYLDITASLFEYDPATQIFVQDFDLEGANSRVEEKRAETTLTHTRTLSPKWDIQASIGVEYSEISQTGDTNLVRDFMRPKGFVSTTYKPGSSLTIRTKIEREVGQLNFFDFISSVSLQDNLNRTGNANLVPEQSWLGEIEFDKKFGQGNTFKARFYGELISDLVDRIPVGFDGDAVGNIDSAHRYGVDLSATVKGDQWGWNGTQLDLTLDLRQSSVEDPLLFFSRRLNNDKKSFALAVFRHDIPDTNWAYGGFYERYLQTGSYRLSTISQYTFSKGFGSVFIEHKDVFGLKVKASARNILNGTDDFRREVYDNRRDIGQLERIEDRSREFGVFYRLEISGAF
ncbi:MAG: hypothetical protein COA69_02310 [Robiginitomaculum sp.]|nr:MAG: hypothetical protein COA69_02310 [Robiginitomaculum sp.]